MRAAEMALRRVREEALACQRCPRWRPPARRAGCRGTKRAANSLNALDRHLARVCAMLPHLAGG